MGWFGVLKSLTPLNNDAVLKKLIISGKSA
jgi:hypothetical protein